MDAAAVFRSNAKVGVLTYGDQRRRKSCDSRIAELQGDDTLLEIGVLLLAAYYAVFVGLTQRNPSTVLAYSSISQMGLITGGGVGLAIGWPQSVPIVLPAIGTYAIHHGFAKAALFLGMGVVAAVKGDRTADRRSYFYHFDRLPFCLVVEFMIEEFLASTPH